MTKELWINLPVKDAKKSRKFFTKLGFIFHERHGENDEMQCMLVGEKKIVVMLFAEEMYKTFIRK